VFPREATTKNGYCHVCCETIMLSFFVSLAFHSVSSVDLYSGSQPAQIFLEYQGNCLFNRSTRVQTSCLVRTTCCIELTPVPEMENEFASCYLEVWCHQSPFTGKWVRQSNSWYIGQWWLDAHPFNSLFWGGSGIIWTICKSFPPRCRQITTPEPHHWIFAGRNVFTTPNCKYQSTESNGRSVTSVDISFQPRVVRMGRICF